MYIAGGENSASSGNEPAPPLSLPGTCAFYYTSRASGRAYPLWAGCERRTNGRPQRPALPATFRVELSAALLQKCLPVIPHRRNAKTFDN
jgi:hypothetical protein